jgi:hypothetical protein
VITLFFMAGWDRYGFNKNHAGTHYDKLVFLHSVGSTCLVVHSGAIGAKFQHILMLRWARCGLHEKAHRDTLRPTCVLHPVGCAGHVVHSIASRARNVITVIFMVGWDRYGFDENCTWTCYTKLVFLHPVEFVGHHVHSGASRA